MPDTGYRDPANAPAMTMAIRTTEVDTHGCGYTDQHFCGGVEMLDIVPGVERLTRAATCLLFWPSASVYIAKMALRKNTMKLLNLRF